MKEMNLFSPSVVVLVSAGSSNAVKDAYPNYFVDMSKFITILKEL